MPSPGDLLPGAAIAVLCSALLVYAAMRAATLSITHDEALTYAWHVSGPWSHIALFRTPGLPDNNHLLFTLLAKASSTLLGTSEFTLRLPSLAGYVLFMVGLHRLLLALCSGGWRVLAFAALATNPYLLDYFSIARGYGLALGLMLLGLSMFVAEGQEARGSANRRASIGYGLLAAAALANVAFLLVFVAVVLVQAFAVVRAAGRPAGAARAGSPWRAALAPLLPTLPLLAWLLIPVLMLRERKLFEIGGTTGFWTDTVGSLVDGTMYGTSTVSWGGGLRAWVVLATAVVAWHVVRTWRDGSVAARGARFIAAVGVLVAALSMAQHALLGVAYLEGRRGLFLVPLFLLAVAASTRARGAAAPA